MQPSYTLKVSGSILLSLFEACGMPGYNPITLRRGRGQFYLVFLRFVERQPYHTLKGSGSLLLNVLKVCGMQGCKPITLFF
mgnify:CR=1 FL=1